MGIKMIVWGAYSKRLHPTSAARGKRCDCAIGEMGNGGTDRVSLMCRIRGLFVTAREGDACLERGQGSRSLPELLCSTVCDCRESLCLLHSSLRHIHISRAGPNRGGLPANVSLDYSFDGATFQSLMKTLY